jgi:hypothetical protein
MIITTLLLPLGHITCIDGMSQRGLGGGCMKMDERREVAPSGAMVVSMVGLATLMHGSLF